MIQNHEIIYVDFNVLQDSDNKSGDEEADGSSGDEENAGADQWGDLAAEGKNK